MRLFVKDVDVPFDKVVQILEIIYPEAVMNYTK